MGLFLSNRLVVFVPCPELADASCRTIRSRGGITSGLPAGLFAGSSFAFEFKLNCVPQIVTNHCYNEGSTPLLSKCVGLTYWSLKLNVILCSWQSELASLCLQGRSASVGVDRPNHPTVWRIHLMQKCWLFFFPLSTSFVSPSCLSIYNVFTHTAIVWYEPRWKCGFVMNLLSAVLLEPLHRLQQRLRWLSFCWQCSTSRLLAKIHCFVLSCTNTRITCWSSSVLILTLMKPLCCNPYGIIP